MDRSKFPISTAFKFFQPSPTAPHTWPTSLSPRVPPLPCPSPCAPAVQGHHTQEGLNHSGLQKPCTAPWVQIQPHSACSTLLLPVFPGRLSKRVLHAIGILGCGVVLAWAGGRSAANLPAKEHSCTHSAFCLLKGTVKSGES